MYCLSRNRFMSATVICSGCVDLHLYRSLAIWLLMATRTTASAGYWTSIQLRNYAHYRRHNNISWPATSPQQHSVGSPNCDVDCNLCTLKYQLLPIERLLFANPTFWMLCIQPYIYKVELMRTPPMQSASHEAPHQWLKGYFKARTFLLLLLCFIV